MTSRNLPYWITTGLFCAVVGFSGFAHFTHVEFVVESMTELGYPVYFMTIIGAWKLLGTAALLTPRQPLLKEWAYAGFAFNLAGAAASHAFSGDPVGVVARPAIILAIGAASYLLRPADRRLPSSPSLGSAPSTAPASGATSQG
ncbi:MAG: DoxX family protein [Deltaproteobacteria bacterium]|nr:DoxX family protein [Deltaproteobacteria bacterium]